MPILTATIINNANTNSYHDASSNTEHYTLPILTAAMIPVPTQNAMGKHGMTQTGRDSGSVTIKPTKMRLKVTIASMAIPITGVTPGPGSNGKSWFRNVTGVRLEPHAINYILELRCHYKHGTRRTIYSF